MQAISRRNILLTGAASTAVLGLAACSGKDDKGGGEGELTPETTATLTFSYWDENQTPGIKAHIDKFNEKYPKIKIETSITPWAQYWTKLRTQAEGGNLPDMFWMNGPNITLYASNGQLEPIDDLGKNGAVDWGNYPEALVDLYTIDGKHYGIPKDFDTLGVWYNKTLFDKAGVEYPSDDWDWDEYHTKAKAISDALKGQNIYGVACNLEGGQEGYYNTMLQAGGFVIEDGSSGYDDPKSIEGLQFWADQVADGSMPSLQTLADTPANVMFDNGKAAMMWSGTWIVSELAEKIADKNAIDLAPLPRKERQASVIHGLTTVISAKSANKAAAKAFLALLGTEEAQRKEAELGVANPAFNGTQEAFEKSQPQWKLSVFADAAKNYAYPYPVSKNTAAWNELESNLLPDAFAGKRPVAEVATELASKMNELLAGEQ